MRRIIGAGAAAVLLAIPSAAAAPSLAAALTTRTVLADFKMTVTYTEEYSQHYMHNQDSHDMEENMLVTMSVSYPYRLTIDRAGKLVDFEQLSPADAKKASAASAGGGNLKYSGKDTLTASGQTLEAQKIYGGSFKDSEVSGALVDTGNGFGVHAEVNAQNVTGACYYHSRNANTNACNAVPLASLAPGISDVSGTNANFQLSADFLQHPPAPVVAPGADAYTNYIMATSSTTPMGMTETGGGGAVFSYKQSWNFVKDNAADGKRMATKTLTMQAQLSLR